MLRDDATREHLICAKAERICNARLPYHERSAFETGLGEVRGSNVQFWLRDANGDCNCYLLQLSEARGSETLTIFHFPATPARFVVLESHIASARLLLRNRSAGA